MKRFVIAALALVAAVQCTAADQTGDEWRPPPPESPDPENGWHREGGWRVCRGDCDDPEAPGSGYRCRDISFFGIKGVECEN